MLRGLWRLTWIEIKVFVREPLGVFGSFGVPILLFFFFGRLGGGRNADPADTADFLSADLPIVATTFMVLSAVISLVAIIAIYREGGILKRLRATPLRPHTILTAHVLVKLVFSTLMLAVLGLLGRPFIPAVANPPVASFAIAVLFSTACVLTLGFVLASVVPTARFAQPLSAILLYPMIACCGLFVPVDALPPSVQTIAKVLPLTYAVSLQRGIWRGEGWAAHSGDVIALLVVAAVSLVVSNRLFRWE